VIGGCLSVADSSKSPVVKKKTAPNPAKSLESKMRPSFEHTTLKLFFFPSSVTAFSTMLNFPSTRFTTSCSHPEDFVNTSTDFCEAAIKFRVNARLAPAAAVARRKSRRFGNECIELLLGNLRTLAVPFGMRTSGKFRKYAVGRPSEFAHSSF